jgi:hypothetical protein
MILLRSIGRLLVATLVLSFVTAQNEEGKPLRLCDALDKTESPVGSDAYMDSFWECTWHPVTQEDNYGPDKVTAVVTSPISDEALQLVQAPQLLLTQAEEAKSSGATVETTSAKLKLDCGTAELATITISGGDMEPYTTGEAVVHCADRMIHIATYGSYYTLQLGDLVEKIEAVWPLSKD